jgi:hypothetical protein
VAKKKAVASKASKTTTGAKRQVKTKASTPKTPTTKKAKPTAKKKPVAAASPAPQRDLTTEQIGHVAGEIWHHLAGNGEQTLTALKKSTDAPGELVMAGIGWLAREGKLGFAKSGRTIKVSLL